MSVPTQQACKFLTEIEMNNAIAWLGSNIPTAVTELGGQDDVGKFILIISFSDIDDARSFFTACDGLIAEW